MVHYKVPRTNGTKNVCQRKFFNYFFFNFNIQSAENRALIQVRINVYCTRVEERLYYYYFLIKEYTLKCAYGAFAHRLSTKLNTKNFFFFNSFSETRH